MSVKHTLESNVKLKMSQIVYNIPGVHIFEAPIEGYYKITVTGSGINIGWADAQASSASTATGTVYLSAGEKIPITIPPYPSEGNVTNYVGGTASFGGYLSADGGRMGNVAPSVSGSADVIINGQSGVEGTSTNRAGDYVRHSNYWGISGLAQTKETLTANKTVPDYVQATPLGKNIPFVIATVSSPVTSVYKFTPDLSSYTTVNLSTTSDAFTYCYYTASYIYFVNVTARTIKIYNANTGALVATRTITSTIVLNGEARDLAQIYLSYDPDTNKIGIAGVINYSVSTQRYVYVTFLEVNETITATVFTDLLNSRNITFGDANVTLYNRASTAFEAVGTTYYGGNPSGASLWYIKIHGITSTPMSHSASYGGYADSVGRMYVADIFNHKKFRWYDYVRPYSSSMTVKLSQNTAAVSVEIWKSSVDLPSDLAYLRDYMQFTDSDKGILVGASYFLIYLGGQKYVSKNNQYGSLGTPRIINYVGDNYYSLNNVTGTQGFRIAANISSQSFEIEGVAKSMRVANPYGVNSYNGGVTSNPAGGGVCIVDFIEPLVSTPEPSRKYKYLELLTWSEINAIAASGEAANEFVIGDKKTITLKDTDKTSVEIVLLGINHDDLASGGKASLTFGLHQCYETRRMAVSPINNATYAWGGTSNELYNYLQNTMYNYLPDDLRPLVKNVNKLTSAGSTGIPALNTNSMKLFCFSEAEVFGTNTNSRTGEGTKYQGFNSTRDRIKYAPTGGNGWWLRSPRKDSTSDFGIVQTNGSSYYSSASTATYGVCFGFCI